jgi:methyl-accepting chemotaxis protein
MSASVEGAETAIIGQMVAEAALLEGQTSKMDEINNTVDSRLESLTISVGNVEEGVNSQVDNIKSINENVAEIVEASTGTYSTQSEIIDEIKKLSPVIRDEVTEIEEKMKETNELLTEKFDEFSELLRKSNTEALVEVMKGVTLEFEKQMSALINKLIQENFEQLNQSVANMNQWQQENKEMIVALTSQYKQMSTDFEETSTTLQKVGDETKSLISDGGRLHQIIEGLEQVMAKDKDFVATANSLKKAAEINEKNMAEYQEYTRNLNVWVQKQRDFVEGVKQLIKKLEELDKLRDFNNDFWAETKKNLEEAQGLMQNGAFFLRKELEGLDQHFYDRLSETLAQLDACIQAMITKNKK